MECGIYPERSISYVKVGMILMGSKLKQRGSWTLMNTFYKEAVRESLRFVKWDRRSGCLVTLETFASKYF